MKGSRQHLHLWRPCRRAVQLAPLAVVLALLVAASAIAQSGGHSTTAGSAGYDLSWWTVDGGGETLTGGGYRLAGLSGQPDAGESLTGGGYTLAGGFWSAGGAAPTAATTATTTATSTSTPSPTGTRTASPTATGPATGTPTTTATGPATLTPTVTATRLPGGDVYLPVVRRSYR